MSKKNPASVSNRIMNARLKAGFASQSDFATVLGVSRGLVGQWESDVKLPGRQNLANVARLTGVSMEYLMGKTDKLVMSVTTETDQEAMMLLAFRRLAPLGKRNIVELLTVGIHIRRGVQQEPEIA